MVEHLSFADPEQRTIEVRTLQGSEYRLTHTLRGNDARAIPPFDSLPIALADLWAR